MRELQQRLGWPRADEAGNFYPHQTKDNHWYYYMYASSAPGLPMNDIATRCCHQGKEVRRDVAVVRSRPEGFASYEETFSRMELLKTVNYYNTTDSSEVFGQRERSRFGERSGFRPRFLDAPWCVYYALFIREAFKLTEIDIVHIQISKQISQLVCYFFSKLE